MKKAYELPLYSNLEGAKTSHEDVASWNDALGARHDLTYHDFVGFPSEIGQIPVSEDFPYRVKGLGQGPLYFLISEKPSDGPKGTSILVIHEKKVTADIIDGVRVDNALNTGDFSRFEAKSKGQRTFKEGIGFTSFQNDDLLFMRFPAADVFHHDPLKVNPNKQNPLTVDFSEGSTPMHIKVLERALTVMAEQEARQNSISALSTGDTPAQLVVPIDPL
jgi:hypothetical protein